MKDREEFYKKLKNDLEATTEFPSEYLYKFIVPTTGNQEAEVKDLFDKGGVIIDTKSSKTGKYVSVSIRLIVQSSDQVIEYYQKAEKIEGIISL